MVSSSQSPFCFIAFESCCWLSVWVCVCVCVSVRIYFISLCSPECVSVCVPIFWYFFFSVLNRIFFFSNSYHLPKNDVRAKLTFFFFNFSFTPHGLQPSSPSVTTGISSIDPRRREIRFVFPIVSRVATRPCGRTESVRADAVFVVAKHMIAAVRPQPGRAPNLYNAPTSLSLSRAHTHADRKLPEFSRCAPRRTRGFVRTFFAYCRRRSMLRDRIYHFYFSDLRWPAAIYESVPVDR